MAYKSSPRGASPVRLIAGHTAEGARTAANLGAYFYRPDIQASSHVGIDAGATLQYVGYDRSAWTLRSGNPISDNAEICGFARWTRAQWLSTAMVDGCANPRAMVDRFADWVGSRCRARGIPIRKLTSAQVAAGWSGVIGHIDWTLGMQDGSHADPGGGFPWDYVISRANQGGGGGATPAPQPPIPIIQSGVEFMQRIIIPASPEVNEVPVRLFLPGGPNCKIIVRPATEGDAAYPVWQNHIYAWASAPGNDKIGIGAQYDPMNIAGFDKSISWSREIPLPGAVWADYFYSSNKDFAIDIYG